MKLIKICFLTLVLTNSVFAQNIDSLFQEFLQSRGKVKNPSVTTISSGPGHPGKCGLSTIGQLVTRTDELSAAQKSQLEIMLDRPDRDTSFVSPGGIFRIHYDLDGPYEPVYDINELAAVYDSSYNYIVNILGYPPHLPDDGLGGDDRYDVYVGGTVNYGETVFESNFDTYFYKSHVIIHHEFGDGFTSQGIEGAMITAAHEYHHAVQLANYGFYSGELYFYEMTSQSMEDFVFDDINEFYDDRLKDYFYHTDNAFADGGQEWGYALCVWNFYLAEKFAKIGEPDKGFDIIKRSWEYLTNYRVALLSIGQALFDHGTSFTEEFSEFAKWCYFTGYRADPVNYFEEGSEYPLVRPFVTYEYEGPRSEYFIESQPAANQYIVFDLVESEFNDTLVSIITNYDIANGAGEPFSKTDYTYILLTGQEPGSSQIINEYYSKMESDNLQILNESNIFNNVLVSGGTVEREAVDYAFPQPFRYSTDFNIFIPVENNDLGYAELKIYTAGMDLVYEDRKTILTSDKIVVQWNARDNNGDKLPTGVYIYATESDDNVVTGKIIIYND